MANAKAQFSVWLDSSDRNDPVWIVDRNDGDTSDTIAMCKTEAQAREICASLERIISPEAIYDNIKRAAAELGRKGGKSTSEAKRAAVRENGRKGGRPICLGTIALYTPHKGRGRILWSAKTGDIRIAAHDQNWHTATDPAMPRCETRDDAIDAIAQAWGNPEFDWRMPE